MIPTVVVWPTWFDLSIVGTGDGAWADALRAITRAGSWTADDDKGHSSTGATTGSSSRLGLARKNISLIPTLAPNATTLTVTFQPPSTAERIEPPSRSGTDPEHKPGNEAIELIRRVEPAATGV